MRSSDQTAGDKPTQGFAAAAAADVAASGKPQSRPRPDRSNNRPKAKAELVRLSDVEPESIAWLWPDRIAIGKLTIIAGDPGLGKSTVTLDIAARVTTGDAWPDSPSSSTMPGSVILLGAEDGLADTIRPRLDAAGADVNRVLALTMIQQENGTRSHVSLKKDLACLEQAIQDEGDVRLVVIDPLTAYMGGIDDHKNAEVRSLLTPLAEMAERMQVAIVLVTHLNKNIGGKATYRLTGSLAYGAAARTVWLIYPDPDRPSRRLMLQVKNNLGPGQAGLAFRIVNKATQWESGPVTLTADQALATEESGTGRQSKSDKVADFLLELLADGPKPAKDVYEQGGQAGFSEKALQRAKDKLGVEAQKIGDFGKGGFWVWELPRASRMPAKPGQHEKPSIYGTFGDQSTEADGASAA